ncbi:hypothetical protein BSKO_12926 [Bryopsis sp. KO-2023]|nr:hypothetical protein BSKO_12926 [Bryopsis sp. KO-2023]
MQVLDWASIEERSVGHQNRREIGRSLSTEKATLVGGLQRQSCPRRMLEQTSQKVRGYTACQKRGAGGSRRKPVLAMRLQIFRAEERPTQSRMGWEESSAKEGGEAATLGDDGLLWENSSQSWRHPQLCQLAANECKRAPGLPPTRARPASRMFEMECPVSNRHPDQNLDLPPGLNPPGLRALKKNDQERSGIPDV